MVGPHVWRRGKKASARLSFDTLNSADFARVTPGMPQLQHVAAISDGILHFVITIFQRVITAALRPPLPAVLSAPTRQNGQSVSY
jgi:hypothetical protein